MKCLKCSGFCLFESLFYVSSWRCLNCGKRAFVNEERDITYTEADHFFRQIDCFFSPIKTIRSIPQYEKLPKVIKACLFCMAEFETSLRRKKYCTQQCGQRYNNKIRNRSVYREIICAHCRNSYIALYKNSIYCCKKCYRKASDARTRNKRNNTCLK